MATMLFLSSTIDFDAYVAASRDETVSSSVISSHGTNTYNNFDTDTSVMYAYTPDSPEAAKENVIQYAGRINGGDFKWTFNNAVDDASYSVNTALKTALAGYQTSLVSIQGDSIADGGNDPGGDPSGDDLIHNFTLSGITSSFYSITGNLSDSKGTVNYSGLTLTQCLKIESATTISFTTTQEATLTLVFNADFTGTIKMNSTSYNATAGILTLTIPAGSYQITKGDVANLYYMSVEYNTATGIQTTDAAGPTLYPNPVINNLNIFSIAGIEKVEIYSLTGVLVKSAGANIKTINMSNLAHGSYLVRVVTEQGIFKQTIIKK